MNVDSTTNVRARLPGHDDNSLQRDTYEGLAARKDADRQALPPLEEDSPETGNAAQAKTRVERWAVQKKFPMGQKKAWPLGSAPSSPSDHPPAGTAQS